jgi:hypothetical protein
VCGDKYERNIPPPVPDAERAVLSMEKKAEQRKKDKAITDPRFAKIQTDARFQVFPNKQRKVEIDERFKGEY